MSTRNPSRLLLTAIALLSPSWAKGQVLVLEDSLRGSTSGTQSGGDLSADGWHVNTNDNFIYWHIPTLPHGAVEFSIRGLMMRENRVGNEDKAELFHMYDWTFDNADTNYFGYRNNPFKHFIRKTGVLDDRPNHTDSMELVWVIGTNATEPDSPVLSWDPAVTYRFREEWGPDGAGNTEIRTYRDGMQVMTMSEPGDWAPAGHAIRIGMARLDVNHGAPVDSYYSDIQVWDLSAASPPPGLDPAPPDALPRGRVRVVGNSLVDDNGAFLGLGATYMTALWQAKNNRAQLNSDLALFRSSGLNYIRALGQVGGDFWAGLEIAPVDAHNDNGTFVPAWPDYVQQLQDLLDIVFANGLRTQITIFGGASVIDGGSAGRQAAVDMVLQAIAGREEKVILIEVANEGWHTGFPDAAGLDEMKMFAEYLNDRTDVPVAITSNHGINSIGEVYAGTHADIATWHTSRDLGVDEGWGPVRDPWELESTPGIPPVSSNEPVGPGSSVSSETNPIHLVMAAAFAWTAKLPMYVFHSVAGVRHLDRFEDMAGLADFKNIRTLIPGDVASWARNDGVEASAPFSIVGGGCVRNTGAKKNDLFVSVPIGVHPEGLELEARQALNFRVYDPLTGASAGDYALAAGQRFTLAQGSGGWVITNVDPSNSTGGLTGEYFNAIDFTAPVLTRTDREINFDWGNGAPAQSIDPDTFSVRWTGMIQPQFSETYTFYIESDDGTRLWVNGQMIAENWGDHGPVEQTGTIDLVADQKYPIQIDYYENVGGAAVKFSWSSASQPKQIVPRERLSPRAQNDAAFVSQDVPAMMEPGTSRTVSVTMKNTGLATWTEATGHRLGTQSPQDNQTFGASRFALAADEQVAPNEEKTFTFDIVAPATPGTYTFQVRMLQEGVEWFGAFGPTVEIAVAPHQEPETPDGGVPQMMMMPEQPDPMDMMPPSTPGDTSGACGCTSAARADRSPIAIALLGLALLALRRRPRST